MIAFRENVSLTQLTSYRIGGPCRYFFAAQNVAELADALRAAQEKKIKTFVLGGGTNLLANDKGFAGLVLKTEIIFTKARGIEIEVGAGTAMADLLDFCAKKGLSGLEWAGGLPGTVGGAIRGNAGAFGGEMKDAIQAVRSLDVRTLKQIERSNKDCRFGYRSSIFKERNGKEVIVGATLTLKKGNIKKIKNAVKEKVNYRLARHPMDYPNIGSIFKNVDVKNVSRIHLAAFKKVIKRDPMPVVPAAYIISETGLKGVSFGGALISPKHPNFIVNALAATSSDVKNLIGLVKGEVKKKFGIELDEEVREL